VNLVIHGRLLYDDIIHFESSIPQCIPMINPTGSASTRDKGVNVAEGNRTDSPDR
jgi:hypothetical protein